MKRVRLVLLAVLCVFVLTPVPALTQTGGTIRGLVVNGTADGGSVAGLEVILHVFQGASEGASLSTTTDAQGRFQFQGLETGTDWVYLVQVSYQDVVYSVGMLAFQGEQNELETEIAVYETTTSRQDISIGRAHILVSVLDVGLEITELYVFANATDRTYVGTEEIDGRRWTSRFLLPEASSNLTFDDGTLGGRFLSANEGFVDTEPQWPGSTQVIFSYTLNCPAGMCDLARKLDYAISNMNVLVPDVGVRVDSKQFVFQDKMDAQGQSYLNYAASDLTPGTDLDLRIRLGSNAAPTGTSASARSSAQALPWIILGTVLVGLVLIYPFWRRHIESAVRKGK